MIISVFAVVLGVATPEIPELTAERLNALQLAEVTACNGRPEALRYPIGDEAIAIRADSDVRRSGDLLSVGRAHFLAVPFHPETISGQSHSYVGRYRAAPIVLLANTKGEGWGYTLVDPASGASVDVAGLPPPGPDGRTFVGVTREEDYHASGVEIVTWRDGRLELTTFWMRACGLAWDGPDRINYRLGFDGHDEAFIERRDGRWTVHSPERPTETPR